MLNEAHMDRLWLRMTRIYGHRFPSAYGESDDGTWLKGLYGITPEQVAHGIGECLKRQDPWPPSLSEFRAMCKPIIPAYHRPFPKLPAPEANPEIASRELSIMKGLVKP